MIGAQLGLFAQKRSSVSLNEKRLVEMTVSRIGRYQFALQAAIRETESLLKKSNESEAVKDVYRNILKGYQDELKYLESVTWEGEEVK